MYRSVATRWMISSRLNNRRLYLSGAVPVILVGCVDQEVRTSLFLKSWPPWGFEHIKTSPTGRRVSHWHTAVPNFVPGRCEIIIRSSHGVVRRRTSFPIHDPDIPAQSAGKAGLDKNIALCGSFTTLWCRRPLQKVMATY